MDAEIHKFKKPRFRSAKRAWHALERKFEEDPVVVMMATGAVLMGAASFTTALTKALNERKKRNIWAKEVNRRDRMTP